MCAEIAGDIHKSAFLRFVCWDFRNISYWKSKSLL